MKAGRVSLKTGFILAAIAMIVALMASETYAQSPEVRDILSGVERSTEEIAAPERGYGNLGADNLDKYHEFKMKREENRLYFVATITVFAFLALLLALFRAGWRRTVSTNYVVNVTGLVLIIYGTLVLTLMAETEQQLTAAIGILGAVAGYLFGTMRRGAEPVAETETRHEPAP